MERSGAFGKMLPALANVKIACYFYPRLAIIIFYFRLSFDGSIRPSNPEQTNIVHLSNICTKHEKVFISIWVCSLSYCKYEFLRFHEKRLPG
jgi:hypothetical protein